MNNNVDLWEKRMLNPAKLSDKQIDHIKSCEYLSTIRYYEELHGFLSYYTIRLPEEYSYNCPPNCNCTKNYFN